MGLGSRFELHECNSDFWNFVREVKFWNTGLQSAFQHRFLQIQHIFFTFLQTYEICCFGNLKFEHQAMAGRPAQSQCNPTLFDPQVVLAIINYFSGKRASNIFNFFKFIVTKMHRLLRFLKRIFRAVLAFFIHEPSWCQELMSSSRRIGQWKFDPKTGLVQAGILRIFLTKFWWWEPILWNFANFGPYRLQNFGKGLVTFVTSCWDKFWKILNFEFCQNRQVMINHRGGILIFCQIFDFGENR